MSKLALRLIAKNKAAHERGEDATSLDLGNCGLTEMPEELFECVWLEELLVSNGYWDNQVHNENWDNRIQKWIESSNRGSQNRISQLPFGFSKMVNLTTLYFGGNFEDRLDLSDIRPLASLTNLQSLDLSYNQIKELGPLVALTSLQSLYLRSNQITELGPLAALTSLQSLDLSSNQITELGPLAALTSLQSLYLSYNQITELGPLAALTSLQSLGLSSNQITELGPLAALTSMQSLYLSSNQITELGPLAALTSLQSLDLSSNQITELGPLAALTSMQSLDLSSNQITEIVIPFLEGLSLELKFDNDLFLIEGIQFWKNPIQNPPLDVLKQGREFAIDFLKNTDKQPLNECKVIIVGRGGVGKTSLQKRLTQQSFDPKESQTHGIRKVSWVDGVKAGDEKPIAVHFWDFGGQDIQQTLHQFFYSKNTVYILVLNKRHDEDPEDFLELIRTYGHNSPVLIAYNSIIKLDDEGKFPYDLIPELDSSLRSKYPNIRRTFGLCCGYENDLGVNVLRKYLQDYIPTLDHVRETYPRSWLNIKHDLLNKVKMNYIPFDDYEELCRGHQVDNQEIQKGLAEMLDTVGTITFFDKQFLGNYYILNPDWLTTGTYHIIDSEQTTNKRGRINYDDLKIIFSQSLLFKYKTTEYEFLLQLMEEFDLCHRFDKGEWLIPSSLEGTSKMDLVAFKQEAYRQYCLQFEVSLPSSVIHRFIARNIKYAWQDDYWKNGIVVKHPDSDTLLFVEADTRERQIRLYAKGERIRDGWEFFRKDLKEFSGEFKYEEQVILPSGDAISYQFLIEAWEAGEESVFISRKTGKINVQESLGLFESPAQSSKELQGFFKLIDDGEIGLAFDKIEILKLNHSDLGQLKKEYRSGTSKNNPDFPDRLRMIIRECYEKANVKFHER